MNDNAEGLSRLSDAIRKDEPLLVTARQARDVIRIIEAAYESSRKGEVIKV